MIISYGNTTDVLRGINSRYRLSEDKYRCTFLFTPVLVLI